MGSETNGTEGKKERAIGSTEAEQTEKMRQQRRRGKDRQGKGGSKSGRAKKEGKTK
jgi:hypothetical protein